MRTLLIVATLTAGCSGAGNHETAPPPNKTVGADLGPSGPSLTSVDVTPATAAVSTTAAAVGTQVFTATGHFSDGTTADVTQTLMWTLSDSTLGTLAGGRFVGAATRGGVATVTVSDGTVSGTAALSVLYSATRVSTDDGSTAPANSGTFFTGTETPALAPVLAYPSDGVKVPGNLGLFEVQWAKPTGTVDLFEVSFESATIDYKLYTNAVQANGGRIALTPAEWTLIADANRGLPVQIKVRGTLSTAPGTIGTSTIANMLIDAEPAEGAIYYFAPKGAATSTTGIIMRHEFGDTTGAATSFYAPTTGGATPSDRCVGCHALTRDGTKMSITYDGGNGDGAALNVASLAAMIPEASGDKWNFSSFSPDGTKIVASGLGMLKIYDSSGGAANGTALQTLEDGSAGHVASHPDWSPDGKSIVYVNVGAPEYSNPGNTLEDWHFTKGAIVIATDMGMGTFGPATVLVPAQAGVNNYYPSFSPDGKWVLFNRGSSNAYNDATAELWVVPVGTANPVPIALGNANTGTAKLTNSWPRWAPFVESEPDGTSTLYLTFSSIRNYGIEVMTQTSASPQPQIWMAAFDPVKAAAGSDPSSVAFWLPYQDVTSHNHIAQWTTTLVPPVQ